MLPLGDDSLMIFKYSYIVSMVAVCGVGRVLKVDQESLYTL